MCTVARLVSYWLTPCKRLMHRVLAGGCLKEPDQDQHIWTHLLGAWMDFFSALVGLELLHLLTDVLEKGNTTWEWDCSPSTLRCSLDQLYETGRNSPIGAGQSSRENGPPLPAEGHKHDSRLVKGRSPSPAELSAIKHSHAEFTLWYRHTPLPHSSEEIQSDLVFRRLFVLLQE